VPEVGLRFNVVLIFAVFTIVLHNGENPLNCTAASSTLVGSKLTSQAIQEIGAHAKIIAARKGDKYTMVPLPASHVPRLDHPEVDTRFQNFFVAPQTVSKKLGKMRTDSVLLTAIKLPSTDPNPSNCRQTDSADRSGHLIDFVRQS
jgi:hypothetical protein